MSDQTMTAVTSNGEVKSTSIAASPATISKEQLAEIRGTLSQLKEMEPSVSLAPAYYEFESKGDSVRCVFLGYKPISVNDQENEGETKEITAVGWMTEDESVFVNAGVNLVSVFQQADIPVGSPVEITYKDKKKVKKGDVKVYDVRPLIAK